MRVDKGHRAGSKGAERQAAKMNTNNEKIIKKLGSRHHLLHSFVIAGLDKKKVIELASSEPIDQSSKIVESDTPPIILDHYPAEAYDKEK